MNSRLQIGDRTVGPGFPCFFIAEAGVNHNGSRDLALRLVDAAADAGADAVKFQTFKAEKVVTAQAKQAEYQVRNLGKTETQLEMIRRLQLTEADHLAIIERCRERNIHFLSTPFDAESADFLDSLGMDVIKIPSGEVTNIPFIRHLASKQRPILLSTGMCNLGEVEEAVEILEEFGCRRIAILHCVSNYPAAPEDTNLLAMRTLAAAFGHPVGYSDHTLGNEIPLAAAALGASVIEKHFTLDRAMPGPDHRASSEPHELQSLIRAIRIVESALGTGRKRPAASEANTAEVARRSVVANRVIPAGAEIREEDLGTLRPGTGLPPAMISRLTGMTARHDISPGTIITLKMIS